MKMPIRSFSTRSFDIVKNLQNRFLFSLREIILFLHQIFYKGLSKKLENWPTFYTGSFLFSSSIDRSIFVGFFLGDLFDMFISMLHIYLEYVRNHHYSLQVWLLAVGERRQRRRFFYFRRSLIVNWVIRILINFLNDVNPKLHAKV